MEIYEDVNACNVNPLYCNNKIYESCGLSIILCLEGFFYQGDCIFELVVFYHENMISCEGHINEN